jgi:hypothetical protein
VAESHHTVKKLPVPVSTEFTEDGRKGHRTNARDFEAVVCALIRRLFG